MIVSQLTLTLLCLMHSFIFANGSVPFVGEPDLLFSFLFYPKLKFLYANNVEPAQMLCSKASDLGLHYLQGTNGLCSMI